MRHSIASAPLDRQVRRRERVVHVDEEDNRMKRFHSALPKLSGQTSTFASLIWDIGRSYRIFISFSAPTFAILRETLARSARATQPDTARRSGGTDCAAKNPIGLQMSDVLVVLKLG
jgi:hypothetical protein